jgi:hypothetical protein
MRLPILPMFNANPSAPCYCNKIDKATQRITICDEVHVLNCAGDNTRSNRHHEVVAAMMAMYQSVQLQPVLEPLAVASTVSTKRHDLSVHMHQSNTVLKLDITIRNPLNNALVTQAAKYSLHAAIAACREKTDKYKQYLQPGEKFVPIVLETFGAMHHFVSEQISLAGQRANHLPPPTATWAAPSFEQYWTQRVSVTLNKANAQLATAIIQRTKARSGQFDELISMAENE